MLVAQKCMHTINCAALWFMLSIQDLFILPTTAKLTGILAIHLFNFLLYINSSYLLGVYMRKDEAHTHIHIHTHTTYIHTKLNILYSNYIERRVNWDGMT